MSLSRNMIGPSLVCFGFGLSDIFGRGFVMAFRLPVHLKDYEFRGRREGTGQNGPWLSLILEDPEEARQINVSVPQRLQSDVNELNLKKGDVLELNVIAFAGEEYSRITLVEVLRVVDADGEVQY